MHTSTTNMTYRRAVCNGFCDNVYRNAPPADPGTCLSDSVCSCQRSDRRTFRADRAHRRPAVEQCSRRRWQPPACQYSTATRCVSVVTAWTWTQETSFRRTAFAVRRRFCLPTHLPSIWIKQRGTDAHTNRQTETLRTSRVKAVVLYFYECQ